MRLRSISLSIIFGFSIIGCEEINERLSSSSLPPCESTREVAGWKTSAGLSETQSGREIISGWEVERNFSSFFGLRITYDSSQSQTPYLKIWHDYKSGEFTMRLPDETRLTARLKANTAVSTAQMRSEDVEAISRQPVRIEHTSHDGKWKVYQTDGLPEAIEAAHSDLALLRQKQDDNECAI